MVSAILSDTSRCISTCATPADGGTSAIISPADPASRSAYSMSSSRCRRVPVSSGRGGRRDDVGAFRGLEQGEERRRGGHNPIAGTAAYPQAPARLWPRPPPLNLPASFAIRGVRVLKAPGTVGLACAGLGPASILAVAEKSRSDVHHVR